MSVRRLVGRLVGWSVRPSVPHELKSWNNAIFQSNLVKLYYETWNYTIWHATKGYWPCWYSPQTSISTITRTSTLENTSIVRTLFDLFLSIKRLFGELTNDAFFGFLESWQMMPSLAFYSMSIWNCTFKKRRKKNFIDPRYVFCSTPYLQNWWKTWRDHNFHLEVNKMGGKQEWT